MIRIIPSEERFVGEHGWLTSRHSFSFAQYYDPDNIRFGPLRVFNEDIVQPGKGFGTHPHADMEIMSYVIDGVLEHKDSMGNTGLLRRGEVQRMTAGTGVTHSEYNHSDEEPVHFLQIWFLPEKKGLKPSWEQKDFHPEKRPNRWVTVVSREPEGDALSIHQDVKVHLAWLEPGKELSYRQDPGRRMYLFVIRGEIVLNGEHGMKRGDTARISDETDIWTATEKGAELMLLDLCW